MASLSSTSRLLMMSRHLSQGRRGTLSSSLISPSDNEILFEERGNKRIITLNRQHALNAFTGSMTLRMSKKMKEWQEDNTVSLIMIRGSEGKAFCVGGDIKEMIAQARQDSSLPDSFEFLRDEHTAMYLIATCRVPYIALCDGYTMGGGLGLAANGQYRVATERTDMAMPETAIGLFPNYGGSHFLNKLRGQLGMYLALTCKRLRGEEAFVSGLATHYVTVGDGSLAQLQSDLLDQGSLTPDAIKEILDRYHKKCYSGVHSDILNHQDKIDQIFGSGSLAEVVSRLREDNSEWSCLTLQEILSKSPTAQLITWNLMQKAKTLDVLDCLRLELILVRSLVRYGNSDLYRGVQAVLVDKTMPVWDPHSLDEVSPCAIASHFKSPKDHGLSESVPKL